MHPTLTVEKPRIVVIGSANFDLVVPVRHLPRPGETVLGGSMQTVTGGKGANQAVAAARLGAAVSFVGRIGDDDFGDAVRERLAADNVNCTHLLPTPEHRTGVALITVAHDGQNAIAVAPGANAELTTSDIGLAETVIANARACVLQLEIPPQTARFALELARRHGVQTVLDPAPVPNDAPEGLLDVDIVTPNETEGQQLLGSKADVSSHHAIAAELRRRGAAGVVLKLGAAGAFVLDEDHAEQIPGFEVDVVDTTAAGDAFTGALAVAHAMRLPLIEATRFANAAGALACTRHGAQPSLPTRAAVEKLLAQSS